MIGLDRSNVPETTPPPPVSTRVFARGPRICITFCKKCSRAFNASPPVDAVDLRLRNAELILQGGNDICSGV